MFANLNSLVAVDSPQYWPGLKVVLANLYNPYANAFDCEMTYNVAETIVTTLNAEFARRAAGTNIRIANTYDRFIGFGAGGGKSHVFGDECADSQGLALGIVGSIGGLFGAGDAGGLQRNYDPHPNDLGAEDIALAIVDQYNKA